MSLEHTLLIVESDLREREQMSRRFLRAGFQVTAVNHPRCALEAATFRPFEVAILDATQPELDGVQLATRLLGLIAGVRVIVRCENLDVLQDSSLNDKAIWLVAKSEDLHELEQTVEWAVDAGRSGKRRRSKATELA